ncbi:MAG: hypothetical protein PHS07_02130 [Patescibacteria group bacterium]|nr:hypothetical protein [Patescibacteria group bacterium]
MSLKINASKRDDLNPFILFGQGIFSLICLIVVVVVFIFISIYFYVIDHVINWLYYFLISIAGLACVLGAICAEDLNIYFFDKNLFGKHIYEDIDI